MAKDPAVLFFINDWLTATKGMKADAKGWYLNLILFQFSMGDLPNDIEELANLCDVRISEYEKFKQVFEQVLKQKFKLNDKNRLENGRAKDIIQKRELFKQKRSNAGKLSYVLKFFRANFKTNKKLEQFIKDTIDLDFDIKDEQVLKQVFEQTLELYRNENGNENKDKNVILYNLLKTDFLAWYVYKKKGVEYYFAGRKDGPAIYGIIDKLKFSINSEDLELSDENIQATFRKLLKSNTDKWINDNLSLTIINSKYNEIIGKITSGEGGLRERLVKDMEESFTKGQ